MTNTDEIVLQHDDEMVLVLPPGESHHCGGSLREMAGRSANCATSPQPSHSHTPAENLPLAFERSTPSFVRLQARRGLTTHNARDIFRRPPSFRQVGESPVNGRRNLAEPVSFSPLWEGDRTRPPRSAP